MTLEEVLCVFKCYLFMQVDKLAKELETQQKKKEALEARAIEAEKKISELNLKLADVSSLCVRILENA